MGHVRLLVIVSGCIALLLAISSCEAQETNNDATGNYISNFFSNTAQRFRTWGENLWGRFGGDIQDQAFERFRKLYNKTYSASELSQRFKIYADRLNFIENWNKLYEQGKVSYSLKPNHLADWTDGELNRLNGLKMQPDEDNSDDNDHDAIVDNDDQEHTGQHRLMSVRVKEPNSLGDSLQDSSIPTTKDWRNIGCVPSVRDQMHCGAAYAAAALDLVTATKCLGASEKYRTPAFHQLSMQQIIDCGPESKNASGLRGCNGGNPLAVLDYLKDNPTRYVAIEHAYEFTGREGKCRNITNAEKEYLYFYDKTLSTLNSEEEFLEHVAKRGPIVAMMHASTEMNFYESGVFNDPTCSRVRANHPILIIGYGKERGRPYWLLKNSWGTEWGINGYMKIARGKKMCRIGSIGWGYVKRW